MENVVTKRYSEPVKLPWLSIFLFLLFYTWDRSTDRTIISSARPSSGLPVIMSSGRKRTAQDAFEGDDSLDAGQVCL